MEESGLCDPTRMHMHLLYKFTEALQARYNGNEREDNNKDQRDARLDRPRGARICNVVDASRGNHHLEPRREREEIDIHSLYLGT